MNQDEVPAFQKNDTKKAVTRQMFGRGGSLSGSMRSTNGTLKAPGKLKRRGK